MENPYKVLIVDDEESVRKLILRQLAPCGYDCTTASGGWEALQILKDRDIDVMLVDLAMPEMDGIELIAVSKDAGIDAIPVVLSAVGRVASAVEVLKGGAFDFLEKPASPEMLRAAIDRAAEHRRLRAQTVCMTELARQWEGTFDAVADLIAIIDKDYRFVRVNKAMADAIGCTPLEAIGKCCHDCVHDTPYPPMFCPHLHAISDLSERVIEIEEEHLNGWFRISVCPLRDARGQLVGAVHVAHNITESKTSELELRKAHLETERLLASMSSFLMGLDMDKRIIRWNVAAEAIFGMVAKDVIGKHIAESGIQWDWKTFNRTVGDWIGTDENIRFPELEYTCPDGAKGFLGISLSSIRNEDGMREGFFILGADITERRMLQVQLVHAQKLESIGQLAAGIAHEINTPTQYVGDNLQFLKNSVDGLTKLLGKYEQFQALAEADGVYGNQIAEIEGLRQEIGLDYLMEQVPRALQQSLDGVGRVSGIVQAMKEFSHPSTGEKTPVDLNRAIESTITVARNEWKYVADVKTEFDADLPAICCLPGEFNQVILNILVNAAHAIADVVRDAPEGKGTITVRTRRDGEWAEVQIQDTGAGIPENIRNRVFDPFFTTKEVGKGTGQGLAIAHNVICDKHGGTIRFDTETGKGTTFIIRLPIKE